MSIGSLDVIGSPIAIGAFNPDTAQANFDPFAAVFDDPAVDVIYLVELDYFDTLLRTAFVASRQFTSDPNDAA